MTGLRIVAAAAAVGSLALTPLAFGSSAPGLTELGFAHAEVNFYAKGLPVADQAPVGGVDKECFAPPTRIDPDVNAAGVPTNPKWILRDEINQYCATLRLRDQFTSPAYVSDNAEVGDQLYLAQAEEQAGDGPGHIHGGLTTLVPGAQAADPFRALAAWQQETGGRVTPIKFTSSDGAQLRGHIFLPPKSEPKPRGGYPGVVITDGSIQAFENLYYWAAEGLAQYGFEVMTYDVQGQGDSDLLPGSCTPTDCPGVPYQQNYNFYQGAEDSLNFFDSNKNPGYHALDTHEIGIAGHSLGAAAVSWVGQCDKRVKTIVAWDDLSPVSIGQCKANVTVPKADRATKLHAPALATTNDYEFNVQPQTSVPNPHGSVNGGGGDGDSGFLSLSKAGLDSEIVSFRDATHLTYSYIPYVFPANELGERFAFYYTLAWFDEYLRGGHDPYTSQPAFRRLTTLSRYDASADSNTKGTVSIGAGTYDAADVKPTDPTSGNVPYRIKGIPILGSLSFYYYSEYRLTDPTNGKVRACSDMLAHCPKVQPATP